ncbi:MAG: PadR family transcriptional regulator [Acidimicrobiales bacterium]
MDRQGWLPTTTYAILGLLRLGGEASGYEVRTRAEDSLRFIFWQPAQSQIYTELQRLEQLGWVSATFVPQRGRPNKTVYKITADGRRALDTWLRHAPVEPPSFKHTVALRLFLSEPKHTNRLREVLDTYGAHLAELRAELQAVHEQLVGSDDLALAELVAWWGERFYDAELATIAEAGARLDALDNRSDGR